MKLTKLRLENYKGAENINLDLHPRLTVFIGTNGAGKSSILESIVIMLSWVINRIKNPRASGKQITEEQIHNKATFANIFLTCEYEDRESTWQLHKSRKGRSSRHSSDFNQIRSYVEYIREQIATTGTPQGLPLLLYYPVNRLVLDVPLKLRKKKGEEDFFAAFGDSLETGTDFFRTFFGWFREREDLENENYRILQEGEQQSLFSDENHRKIIYPDPQLQAVRTVVESFLPGFSNLTVRRRPLRMVVNKKDEVLSIQQLSDGEKCLLAMVADLARRLAILYEHYDNPLEAPGIILIDELDLHLHPAWQRRIIPKLLNNFPNCQFIITTHSPHIITHVHAENLRILKNIDGKIKISLAAKSYGKTVERILEDLMGLETTRPTEIDEALKLIFNKLVKNQLDEARRSIQELKEIHQEMQSDPDLTKAEGLLRRKEIIGK